VQYACPLDLPRANQHGGVRGRGINGSSALVHAGAFGPAGYSRSNDQNLWMSLGEGA
jgi:hypothetical protein